MISLYSPKIGREIDCKHQPIRDYGPHFDGPENIFSWEIFFENERYRLEENTKTNLFAYPCCEVKKGYTKEVHGPFSHVFAIYRKIKRKTKFLKKLKTTYMFYPTGILMQKIIKIEHTKTNQHKYVS